MNKLGRPCSCGGVGCSRCTESGYVHHGWIHPTQRLQEARKKLPPVQCQVCGSSYVNIDRHINKRHVDDLDAVRNWLGPNSPTVLRLAKLRAGQGR